MRSSIVSVERDSRSISSNRTKWFHSFPSSIRTALRWPRTNRERGSQIRTSSPWITPRAPARAAPRIRTRTPVVGVYLDGRRPTRIETTNGVKPVDCVINPVGPSGGEIAAMVGVLRSEGPYEPERPTLSYISRAPDMYLKPKPSGSFLAGGIDQSLVDQSVGLRGVDESFLRAVVRPPKERIPEYADAGVVDS